MLQYSILEIKHVVEYIYAAIAGLYQINNPSNFAAFDN